MRRREGEEKGEKIKDEKRNMIERKRNRRRKRRREI